MIRFLPIVFFFTPLVSPAQDTIIKAFETSENRFATLDRAGDLYLVKTSGDIEKFNSDGQLLCTFHRPIPPTLFDTGNGVRLLIYYRGERGYSILSPSLVSVSHHKIDSAFVIEPWLVCSSGDYNLWILDAADWSLRKIDTRNDMVLTESQIDTTQFTSPPSFTYMREYQNFLFLLHPEGILIFNSAGKFLRVIPAKSLSFFNFMGEDLYFVQEDKLIFVDLFTLERTERSLQGSSATVLITDELMYRVSPTNVEIRKFKP